jgi:DNA-binding transcriptional ArsR family regulator
MSKAEPIVSGPAPVFAALADPTRLSLLMKLSDGRPRSISELTSDRHLTRQAVTKHLDVLAKVGLVSNIRVGRESLFSFRPEPVSEARSYLDMVSTQWDESLSRLQSFLEE